MGGDAKASPDRRLVSTFVGFGVVYDALSKLSVFYICTDRAAGSGSRPELESVGVDRFEPESESELESIKFDRLRLQPGVAVYQPSTDDDFGRMVIYPYENIERHKEKESGSVQIKPRRD